MKFSIKAERTISCLLGALILLLIMDACKKTSDTPSPAQPIVTIVYQDSLLSNKGTWLRDSTNQDFRKFTSAGYEIGVANPNWYAYSTAPYATINFTYSVKINCVLTLKDTIQTGTAGILFNYVDDKNFSLARIYNTGCFDVWKYVNANWIGVVWLTKSNFIKKEQGSINTLELIQNSQNVQFKINNNIVATIISPQISSYVKVGVTASTTSNTYAPTIAVFTKFILSKIQ